MNITIDNFSKFVDGSYDYDPKTKTHTGLHLYNRYADVGGGTIYIDDIDVLKSYPNVDTVGISGLHQYTFEYFIKTYGHQLKAIRFFKNKMVEDWSLLGSLPNLEYVSYFANQRITSLWDMSGNTSLKGLAIENFSRLHGIKGIEKAPALKYFDIGDAIDRTTVIDSFMPLAGTQIEHLRFSGKAIEDNDLSFLNDMKSLKSFDFATNLFTTEQVAWIVANFPQLEGFALRAKRDTTMFDWETKRDDIPAALIVGKRKPMLKVSGNEVKIQKYVANFEALVEKYKGAPQP